VVAAGAGIVSSAASVAARVILENKWPISFSSSILKYLCFGKFLDAR
jgi:hypothetical protein